MKTAAECLAEVERLDALARACPAGPTPRRLSECGRWLAKDPIVGQKSENPALREWHTNNLGRLPGLKFMRTLWVCKVAGGPLQYTATKPGSTPVGLEVAHRDLRISPAQFDEVAAELGRTLAVFNVPKPETDEVLAAFAAHKGEVTAGYSAVQDTREPVHS